MTSQTNQRPAALLMAVYTFLLALGAVLPFAASYSESITNRSVETHIQSGAYQRRVQVCADASDSITVEPRESAIHFDGIGTLGASELEGVSDCRSNVSTGNSRGS